RPACPPAYACGMTAYARMLQPDFVGHDRCLDMQRTRLQQFESAFIQCPFDLDRSTRELLAFAQQPAERHGFSWRKGWLAHEIFWHEFRCRNAMRAGLAMALATGLDGAQEAVLR